MSSPDPSGRVGSMTSGRAGRIALAAVGAAVLVAVTACSGSSAGAPSSSAAAAASSSAAETPTASADSSLPPLPATPGPLAASATSPPVRVDIPSIGVSSTLENLGLLANGAMASPSQYPRAGWYDKGVKPGDNGPAIIAGHVDSYQGPAVFYRLGDLKAGDPVTVTRADGSTVKFVVESAVQYPKAQFPTDAVYGPTPTPELKLITCSGIFDRAARSYESNLIVTAALVS